MSASPTARFPSHSEAVANGWFSRRNRTNEAHNAAKQRRVERERAQINLTLKNHHERSLRTPAQQIARLDSLLGRGQGAKKERARLAR